MPPPPAPSAPGAEPSARAVSTPSSGPGELAEAIGVRRRHRPVAHGVLKAFLPEALAGLVRKEARSEATGGPGAQFALAEAEYVGGAEAGRARRSLLLRVTDLAGAETPPAEATGWANAEIHQESAAGFERTTVHQGRKAFEKVVTGSQGAEAQVLVADRFLVEASGTGIPL